MLPATPIAEINMACCEAVARGTSIKDLRLLFGQVSLGAYAPPALPAPAVPPTRVRGVRTPSARVCCCARYAAVLRQKAARPSS